jgi:hypothetical protein
LFSVPDGPGEVIADVVVGFESVTEIGLGVVYKRKLTPFHVNIGMEVDRVDQAYLIATTMII